MNMRSPSPAGRYQAVDATRGTAVLLMAAYHFAFDLNYFGIIHQNMNHQPVWLGARAFILSLFLLTMGTSLYLATRRGVAWRPYLRRLGAILGSAGLVSLASWVMFPRSWIFFGVLHFIALASVLGLAFVRLGRANLLVGLGLLALGALYGHAFFDQPAWQWFGLMTHKPFTEDYVPLLPWFGMVLMGIFLGHTLYGGPGPAWTRASRDTPAARTLAWTGRHALVIYLFHQPLLLGVVWLGVVAVGN